MARINVRELQTPIRQRYKDDPQAAQIRLRVRSTQSDLADPLHCAALPVTTPDITWRSGAHPAVGGTGDVPCSGDLLLGALAACQETTIRMVAANMGIELASLEVEIEADWDARGTLAMGDYPIGLTGIRSRTRVTVPADVKGERAERLLRSAEKYCVVLNTLRNGVPVESAFSLNQAGSPGVTNRDS
ncbi:MAG TPA: OsmC family protein [Candidatus Dormibacteraeota bacterium]